MKVILNFVLILITFWVVKANSTFFGTMEMNPPPNVTTDGDLSSAKHGNHCSPANTHFCVGGEVFDMDGEPGVITGIYPGGQIVAVMLELINRNEVRSISQLALPIGCSPANTHFCVGGGVFDRDGEPGVITGIHSGGQTVVVRLDSIGYQVVRSIYQLALPVGCSPESTNFCVETRIVDYDGEPGVIIGIYSGDLVAVQLEINGYVVRSIYQLALFNLQRESSP